MKQEVDKQFVHEYEPKTWDQLALLFRRLVASINFYSGRIDTELKNDIARGQPAWRILRYEHVINPEEYPLPLSRLSYVRPEAFERQLRYFVRHCHPISLPDLITALRQNQTLPPKTVALTFDGAWADHAIEVVPRLLRYGVPATFLLPTAYLGTKNLFWPDWIMLALFVMAAEKKPFPKFSFLTEDSLALIDSLLEDEAITLPSIAAFIEILRQTTPKNRALAVATLGEIVNQLGGYPGYHLFFSWNDAKYIADLPRMTIGSMSHRGGRFSELSREELANDLRDSFLELRNHNIESKKFVAPPEDELNDHAIRTLNEIGIEAVLSNTTTIFSNAPGSAMLLRRVPVFEAIGFCQEIFAGYLWKPMVSTVGGVRG